MEEIRRLFKEKRIVSINELVNATNLKPDYLASKVEDMEKKGIIKKYIEIKDAIYPGDRLYKIGTLPEEIIFNYLIREENEIELDKLEKDLKLDKNDIKAGISYLIKMRSISIKKRNDKVYIVLLNKKIPDKIIKITQFLKKLLRSKRLYLDEITDIEKEIIKDLKKRPGYIKIVHEKNILIELVGNIDELIDALYGEYITLITPEIIRKRLWIGKKIKPYDLNIKTFKIYPGRIHPMRELIREVREIFLKLGFREEYGPLIEVAFINFDMLFQPQDHPARDMQDTFYLKKPKYGKIPYNELIENIRKTHENGWKTGSTGWMYKWSVEEAKKLVLRTHTTSVTVRALYETGEKEDKIFCIGSVFRNETIDYKHLAEFMQVDGIIIHPDANIKWLMGVIKHFYKEMGFEKVKFWPSYFPYTEPSIQPSIYVDKWGKWLELGGAGIFRPEVTIPLGVKWPVPAWGLGLERLLMIKYDIDDIRLIYKNDLGWLRGVPIRQ